MTATPETAAQLDLAIDDLLAEGAGPRSLPEVELLATARLVRESLPRFHPRFSFEEHLAARLAGARAHRGGELPEPTPLRPVEDVRPAEPEPAAPAGRRRRAWVAGGAIAGGAIASGVSIVIPIAAVVVRRRARSSGGLS